MCHIRKTVPLCALQRYVVAALDINTRYVDCYTDLVAIVRSRALRLARMMNFRRKPGPSYVVLSAALAFFYLGRTEQRELKAGEPSASYGDLGGGVVVDAVRLGLR